MSFNTFCGQDPANAATYNKVLLRFQEGGGGGVAAVNAGANIDIPFPLVPVVALRAPLNANLDLGLVDVVDSGGVIGAAGTVLSSNGAGAGTSWIAAVPAGNVAVPNDNTNVNRFLTFVAATGGVQQIYADSGAGAVSVNPNQGDFNVVDTLKIDQTSVAVGKNAGSVGQGLQAVAIGLTAGQTNQGGDSIAIGSTAGQTAQGISSIAIGERAGETNQSNSAVAIGGNAGLTAQGDASVAVGIGSGASNQGNNAVAVGNAAGNVAQGIASVAVGIGAGQTNQGAGAVAIGSAAGQAAQGANAIAIGEEAGSINQTANSICINATGVAVQTTTAGLYIDPIVAGPAIANPVPAATQFLTYDTATKEITYRDGAGIGGGGGGGTPITNTVPWGFETAITGSTGVMTSAPAVDFMFNLFSAQVSNLYDPTTPSPPLYSNVVMCECYVNCVIPEAVFIPNLPYSTGTTNGLNDPAAAGVPATQILWHLQYYIAPTAVPISPTPALSDFSSFAIASSPVLNFPQLSFFYAPPQNYFQSSVSIVGELDLTGVPTTSYIFFYLAAYTNTGSIDTRTTTGGTQGQISMRCYPVRNP